MLSTAMALPIFHLSNDGGCAWGDAGAIPTDKSVSTWPYVHLLGMHKVAPATPAVAAFLLPTAVESPFPPHPPPPTLQC